MPRKFIFLVHGVGRHPEGQWHIPWKNAILKALRNYAPYKTMSDVELDKVLAFVPINYDSIFEGFRNDWGNLAKSLNSQDIITNTELLRAIKWVSENDSTADANFFWDNVLDAILWYAFPIARSRVIAKVAEQFVNGLIKMYDENNGINTSHVLAHSLGTSVCNDALISLRSADSIHSGALSHANHQWRSVYMISNTSRLLHTDFKLSDDVSVSKYDPYTSDMNPGSDEPICMRYTNVCHVADPISWPRKFAPANWPASSYCTIQTVNYNNLKKVHDIEHYVASPWVHIPFFRSVFQNDKLGTKDEVTDVIRNFKSDFPSQATDEFSDLRSCINGDEKFDARKLTEFLLKAYKELR